MKRRAFLKCLVALFLNQMGVSKSFAAMQQKAFSSAIPDDAIRDYLYKMRNYDKPSKNDVYLDGQSYQLLASTVGRLHRLQRFVGHGNFQIIGFDRCVHFARHYHQVGRFPRAEIGFLEKVFYEDAGRYGFYGEKKLENLTTNIETQAVVKLPKTGNYLFAGTPLKMYEKMVRDLGPQVILTSGVRGIPKQLLLYLNKALKNDGNLSLASRSLAPPGYSFHGVGDFDVGQAGFGAANFTDRFTKTTVCKQLCDLGYLDLRYEKDNRLGVRFEPWHIKVRGV